jgi:hypothetical protein
MADTPRLTSQDFDPWHLATPLELLALLERLGVAMSDVARCLRVPRSSISMWRHGARSFPPKHRAALYEYTRRSFDAQADVTDKAARLAPTAELREAILAEFGALWQKWKVEVLYEAGTLRRALVYEYESLAPLIHQEYFSADDRETMALKMETMLVRVDLIRQQQGEVPSAEEELLARLTEAHEAVQKTPQPDAEGTNRRRRS